MGGCYFHGIPQAGKDVAAAFFAGKPKKRTNCETDGEHYWLLGTCLARRLDVPMAVVRAMEGGESNPERLGEVQFTWGGYPGKMTARHLCALGLDASFEQHRCLINKVEVNYNAWYTRAEIDALVYVPPPVKVREPKFVNLTAPLFA